MFLTGIIKVIYFSFYVNEKDEPQAPREEACGKLLAKQSENELICRSQAHQSDVDCPYRFAHEPSCQGQAPEATRPRLASWCASQNVDRDRTTEAL